MKTEADFLHLALHSYSNVQCNTVDEFNSDLERIKIVRRMIVKFKTSGEISLRLVLNHFVILFNVFGSAALQLILFRFEKEYHSILFPFLDQINRLPEEMRIEFDPVIVEELRKL
jgi:hypothetical protein